MTMKSWKKKTRWLKTAATSSVLAVCTLFFSSPYCYGNTPAADYATWETVGKRAADEAISLMRQTGKAPQKGNLIVLTNGGYAEVNGASTQGILDGLSLVTGASRGRHTLVEIHSAPWTPLWCAIYDKGSGLCAYFQIDPSAMDKKANPTEMSCSKLFCVRAVERVNAEYLYKHATKFKAACARRVFGGNEFRIITIVNAIAEGAPAYAVRVFEFHDHFCPGVTSGILMVNYLKKHFPAEAGRRYFVHAVEPWCKEDAFLVLLNATPGKRSYAVDHPTKTDKERVVSSAKGAATIVYRKKGDAKNWEGLVLAFQWSETGCPKTENRFLDKLCEDLWYLKRLEKPEDFVRVIKTFELPEGVSPKDWARPGVDPLKQLRLLRK